MNLNKFTFSDQMHSALERNNINYVEEAVLLSPKELSRRLGIDSSICREFIDLISSAILPQPLLVPGEMFTLKTGLQQLDALGGIPAGQLFEVFGEAGGDYSIVII